MPSEIMNEDGSCDPNKRKVANQMAGRTPGPDKRRNLEGDMPLERCWPRCVLTSEYDVPRNRPIDLGKQSGGNNKVMMSKQRDQQTPGQGMNPAASHPHPWRSWSQLNPLCSTAPHDRALRNHSHISLSNMCRQQPQRLKEGAVGNFFFFF